MKFKFLKYYFIITVLFIIFCIHSSNINASSNLGIVQKYITTVSTNPNGLLNIVYNIEIKFDEDNIDKIDIKLPSNSYMVQNKCSKISDISPSGDEYSTIKFSDKYNSGDKLTLNFSLLHAHVYKKNNDECIYKISFGKIKNFAMGLMKVQWIKKNVIFSGLAVENDKYYVWEKNYSALRDFNVSTRYKKTNFNLTDNGEIVYGFKDYFSNYGLIAIAGLVTFFEIVLNIIRKVNRGW